MITPLARSTMFHSNYDDGRVDELIVEEAVSHGGVRLRPAETCEAVRRLTARGWTQQRIAERIGAAHRTVQRHQKHGVDYHWSPAKPGDTPGELVPGEADEPQPIEAWCPEPDGWLGRCPPGSENCECARRSTPTEVQT